MTLRISMVSEHASPLATIGGADAGGQNVHVAALSIALAQLGAEVTVHTRRDSSYLDPYVSLAPGVTVHHVDAGPSEPISKDEMWPYMEEFSDQLRAVWEINRADIVHSHFWMSGFAALRAAKPLGLNTFHTFHALGSVKRRNSGTKDPSPLQRMAVEPAIGRGADRVIATCSDEVFELSRLGVDHRVSVVPCGVDLEAFTPEGPSDARDPRFNNRIVFIGRLVERKGIGNVIEALADVPDTQLVIAGGPDPDCVDDDSEVKRLKGLAQRYGVVDRVVFRGRVSREEAPKLLRSADVVTCVPWYEPFGIVPLEAMACGAPIVASAVGGLIDTVVHGHTGLHVPPRNPRAVARALNHLLENADERDAYGRNGAQRATSLYGWDRIAQQTMAVYRSVALDLTDRTMALSKGAK